MINEARSNDIKSHAMAHGSNYNWNMMPRKLQNQTQKPKLQSETVLEQLKLNGSNFHVIHILVNQ